MIKGYTDDVILSRDASDRQSTTLDSSGKAESKFGVALELELVQGLTQLHELGVRRCMPCGSVGRNFPALHNM